MRLSFFGAAHEVTGSCHLLEACGKNILIDCGMEQGPDLYENQELPVTPGEVDYILLTHAHIDHSGNIPLLVKKGFSGEIITTFATADLCDIMLRDSAHIQEFEAEWRNRKARRSGEPEYEPIYTVADADVATKLLAPVDYGQKITLCDGIEVRFNDVGHLLGSASIEVWVTEGEVSQKIVFSGDVGNKNQPIIKDPQLVKEADYVVIESTYGDRTHGEDIPDYVGEFTRILRETFQKGGNVVIPSFAVGRTQEILYFIREIKEKNKQKQDVLEVQSTIRDVKLFDMKTNSSRYVQWSGQDVLYLSAKTEENFDKYNDMINSLENFGVIIWIRTPGMKILQKIRYSLYLISTNTFFDILIILIVITNSVIMALDGNMFTPEQYSNLNVTSYVFNGIFIAEFIYRFIG